LAHAGTFSSLRNRNFRLFFIGQLISQTGNWLTNVALTLFVLHLGGSGVAVGLLTVCQYGPILLLSAWAGAIADRTDKRKFLFVTQALEMAESVALGVLAFMGHPPLAALLVTAACAGVMLAFDNPVRRSFVSEMVPTDDLPNAVVLYSTSANVSRIFGPSLAGLLVVTVGYAWCFTADAITYLVVLLGLALMRSADLRRTPPTPRGRGQIRESVRYLVGVPVLRISFVTLLVIGCLGSNFNVTLPLLVKRALHGSDGEFTVVLSMFSVGGVVSGLVVASRQLVALRHVIVGALVLGVATVGMGFVPDVAVAVPLAFVCGAAGVLYFTPTTAIVQMEAEPTMHGRLLALQVVFMVGAGALGGLALGGLADVVGSRAPVVISGLVCVAVGVWGALAIRRTAGRSGRANPVRRPDRQPS
jgi:MFS family permease